MYHREGKKLPLDSRLCLHGQGRDEEDEETQQDNDEEKHEDTEEERQKDNNEKEQQYKDEEEHEDSDEEEQEDNIKEEQLDDDEKGQKDDDEEEQQDMVMTQIGYGIVIRWYFEVDASICIFLYLSEYGRVGGWWQWLGFCTAACAPPSDPLWA